jgi:para-nitrobenzyl esterase
MLEYWTSFAKSGKPSASKQPDWPAYGTQRSYMHLGQAPKVNVKLMPGMFDLHDEVVCRRKAQGDQAWNWNVGIIAPALPPRGGCSR